MRTPNMRRPATKPLTNSNHCAWISGVTTVVLAAAVTTAGLAAISVHDPAANPPAVGERAPDFSLEALDGTSVSLSAELQSGPIVLVMLRGWPGYQCPFCVRQFG